MALHEPEQESTSEASAAAAELFATGFDQLEIFQHDDFAKLRETPKFKEVYAAKLEQVKKQAAVEAKRLIAEIDSSDSPARYWA